MVDEQRLVVYFGCARQEPSSNCAGLRSAQSERAIEQARAFSSTVCVCACVSFSVQNAHKFCSLLRPFEREFVSASVRVSVCSLWPLVQPCAFVCLCDRASVCKRTSWLAKAGRQTDRQGKQASYESPREKSSSSSRQKSELAGVVESRSVMKMRDHISSYFLNSISY